MLREHRLKRESARSDGFQIRGAEVSRLEGFTDAAFALAVALLAVSAEVPKTPAGLVQNLYEAPVFAVCFGTIYALWNHHYVFSRRFGLQDAFVRVYTGLLIFMVLMFVYPLKYLFNIFILGYLGLNPSMLEQGGQVTFPELQLIFITYGLAYSLTIGSFALLYGHAYRRREELELTPLETALTRSEMASFVLFAMVGVVSIVIAIVAPGPWKGLAGFAYLLRGVTGTVQGYRERAIRDRFAA